jgi:hypothetical protein
MTFRQSLETWLQSALNDADKDGPCVAVGLWHIKASGGGSAKEEIHTTRIQGTANARQIAELMRDKAETFAGGLVGAQTFRVVAFYGEDTPDNWRASYPLMVNGIIEHDGLGTEGPTKDGLVAQMMRHNEAVMQQAYQQTQRMFERSDRMMGSMQTHFESLARSNQELRQESMEAWEIAKKLVLMQETDDHERRMKEMSYARSSDERAKLMKLLPALANTAFGKEIIPQSTADSAMLEAILEKVSPDQLTMVAQFLDLSPEVMAPLVNRAAGLAQAKKKAESDMAEAKILAAGAGDE